MRIIILSWEYPPYVVGGLGRHVAELAPALTARGHDLHIVTPVKNGSNALIADEDGLTVHRVPVPSLTAQTDIYTKASSVNEQLADYAQQTWPEGVDLIHAHDWLMSFTATTLHEAWQTPLVATVHATERGRVRGFVNSELQQSIELAELSLIEKANRIIVCSCYMSSEVQSFFDTPLEKLRVIPNGVNIEDLQNGVQPDLTAFRACYAQADEPIVFSVSRLVYEKGVHLIVQAAPTILAEKPNTRFVIAGKGPEADNLKVQAESLGVAANFDFIGFVSDDERNSLFKVADCAVFPSLYEPFGIVALEAMALGCPVIVSDVGGLSEIVNHQETGLTMYPEDVNSVSWGILQALNHPETVRAYATKAQQSVEELFNWSRIARLTEELYSEVLHPLVEPI